MRIYNRALRICSAVVLFFFLWSFGPLFQVVAYAATPQGQGSGKQMIAANQPPTTGDRFEKALESIRENISKADEKSSKGQDIGAEIEAIKTKRADIESADVELKKEFAATEKKLKDAKLPKEILDRHAKFVKNYEDNLKELRGNLDGIELAKTTSDRRAKIEKARLHLEKVKAPSKHQKLDPNNLPFRARTAGKKVAPRLKKEDFEHDFPQQKSPKSQRTAELEKFYKSAFRNQNSALNHNPILLAFNEYASDVPFTLPLPSGERIEVRGGFDIPQLAFSDSAPFLLAQATGQPSADDLAETPDVQFTDAIRAKAQELGGKPVNIYNWVRNNIEYAPTYGSIQGADMCLQSKICNDMDTASLLIALLRVSGISAKYVYGTVEMPVEKVMNLVGGVTDPKMAGTVLATNGIPATSLISGGTIKSVQLERVWVKAFIDYIPSRGAVQRQGNSWIPLDASYKQYNYTQGIDIQSAVPFDAQAIVDQLKATGTINETESYATNLNSDLVQASLMNYATQIKDYIAQNKPHATIGDIWGKRTIKKEEYPILLGTLPYKVVQVGSEFSQVPVAYSATITFSIPDNSDPNNSLSYSVPVATLAGRKVTLSYDPASQADVALLSAYGGDIVKAPPYLLKVRPIIKVESIAVAAGPEMLLGTTHNLR